jgi:hypothetical protein
MFDGDLRSILDGEHIGFIGVAAQVGADESALRDDLEAAGADVRKGAMDESAAVPLPLEGDVDLGVDQDDRIGKGAVGDCPDPGVADPQLVAILLLVIG